VVGKHNRPDQVALRKELGQDPHLPTNKNIKRWLKFFNLTWEQIYATDVSVFIKRDAITAKVPMSLLKHCAEIYAIPQLKIVKPLMTICLGGDTFNSLRITLGETPMLVRDALKPNAHTTVNGQKSTAFLMLGDRVLLRMGDSQKLIPFGRNWPIAINNLTLEG
jgi:hypothetical protein